jgi:hypothetical protein
MKLNAKISAIVLVTFSVLILNSYFFLGSEGDTRRAIKVDKPPVIDGILEESIWKTQPTIAEDLITISPAYGEIMPQKTNIWIAYDTENIYIAFKCFDNEPDKIKTSTTKRDNIWTDDFIGLILDTSNNRQEAYEFYVNPNGIQGDLLIVSSTEDQEPDWVWNSAAKIIEDGYTAEIHIPLKNIRYTSGKDVKMGIMAARFISRLGIQGSYPAYPPGKGIIESLSTIVFDELAGQQKIEILPSATYSSIWDRQTPETWSSADDTAELGASVKYGISSSAVAEATINPDFSQVESDQFQIVVNQRYPIFYSEKRPFFMEAGNFFNLAGAGWNNMATAVHTRKIIDPEWGAKFRGEAGNFSFSMLAAGDEFPGRIWDETDGINPYEGKNADYYIGRLKLGLGGENYIGAIYSGKELSGSSNRVAGVDLNLRFADNHNLMGNYLYSFTDDPLNSINSNGGALSLVYQYNTKTFGVWGVFEDFSKDFQMDTAFYNRTGFTDGVGSVRISLFPDPEKIDWLKKVTLAVTGTYLHDKVTEMNDSYVQINARLDFLKQIYFCTCYHFYTESWAGTAFDHTDFNIHAGAQPTNWLNISLGLTTGNFIYYDPVNPFLGDSPTYSISLAIQPNENFSQSFSYTYSFFDRESTGERIYEESIINSKTTYQFDKYFFVRAIIKYDSYLERVLTDLLASYTLSPGTVLHLGYGSMHENLEWRDNRWNIGTELSKYYQTRQSLFFKVSYLLQM